MDIISTAMLAFFGSAFAGGLVGWLVGRFSSFELGLGIGLLIPGIVALYFAAQCLLDYRQFSAPQSGKADGEVIEIEERAVNQAGSVTQPVPVVRFTAANAAVHTVRGPGASGWKVGEQVTVLYDAADPQRARVGQPSQLRGGAIAFMLFGTFPFSLGLWFAHSHIHQHRQKRLPTQLKSGAAPGPRSALTGQLTLLFNLLLVAGILIPAISNKDVALAIADGFGVVAVALLGHGINGLFNPQTDASWCFGMLVLAVNFGVWVAALRLLFV
jgi:hypothetical protein